MDQKLTLYGTSSCHLCEDALAIVLPLTQALRMTLSIVDIAGDDTLEERYGLSIPVLSSLKAGELCWPFDTDKASAFLIRHKN
jgi:hypothetical protein